MARLDNALDVTLEDPTPGLRMMRNRVELKAATLAPSMAAAVDAAVAQCVSTSQEPKATGLVPQFATSHASETRPQHIYNLRRD